MRSFLVAAIAITLLTTSTAFGQSAEKTDADSSAAVSDQDFEKRCRAAVLDLHVFFEEWLNARVPETAESVSRFRDVLADDFEYIGAAGFKLPKSDLFTDGIWPGYGYWVQEGRKGGKTRVEKLEFRRVSGSTAILTWEYWQDTIEPDGGEESRGRLDTGVFRLDAGTPHGCLWLHVQETLLPGMER